MPREIRVMDLLAWSFGRLASWLTERRGAPGVKSFTTAWGPKLFESFLIWVLLSSIPWEKQEALNGLRLRAGRARSGR